MADSHAPVPLPLKDLSLASSRSNVVFSNRLEAVALVICAEAFLSGRKSHIAFEILSRWS